MIKNSKQIIFILLFIFGIEVCVKVQVADKDELLVRKRKIEKEIELTNKLLEETRNRKKNTIGELHLLKNNIDKRNSFINQLNNDIERIEKEIIKDEKTIASLQADLKKVKEEYSALIYYAFKNNNAEMNFMYLLASNNVNIFYSRFIYLQQYKEYRIKQIKLIEALNRAIERKIVELKGVKMEKVNIINQKLVERATMIRESEETDVIVMELKKKEGKLIEELDKKKELAKKLDKEIENIIKRETKKRIKTSLTPGENVISENFATNKGKLPWPTKQGIIIGKFGEHPHPLLKDVKVRNNGIDIATVANAEVGVIFNGVVSKVFTIKGANSTIIVQHGNYFTVYHNLINVTVKAGDVLRMKEKIGIVFTDTKNGESIVHFELWKDLEKQDPELWLSN